MSKLENFINENKNLVSIAKTFSINYLIKRHYFLMFIIFTYLARKIGLKQLGTIEFAKSLCYYFTIFINFGFNYISTQEIAKNLYDKEKISSIFTATYFLKLVLTLLSIPILIFSIQMVPDFKKIQWILVSLWTLSVASGFTPIFLYQGLGKMNDLLYVDIFSKIFFALGIFFFIDSPDDAWRYPVIYATVDVLRSIILTFWAQIKFKIKFTSINFEDLKLIYSPSSSMFLTTLARTIYERLPQLVIKMNLGREAVGLYIIGVKIIGEINMLNYYLMQSIFPDISLLLKSKVTEAFNLIKKIFSFTFPIIALFSGLVFFFAQDIVEFNIGKKILTEAMLQNINISVSSLKVAAIIPMIVYLYSLLGNSVLFPLGKRKLYTYSITAISLIFSLLYIFEKPFTIQKVVNTIVIAEIATLLSVIIYSIPVLKKFFKK